MLSPSFKPSFSNIFVIDSDLRSYEMEVIKNLSKVGKKLFIALNKCDLLSDNEKYVKREFWR